MDHVLRTRAAFMAGLLGMLLAAIFSGSGMAMASPSEGGDVEAGSSPVASMEANVTPAPAEPGPTPPSAPETAPPSPSEPLRAAQETAAPATPLAEQRVPVPVPVQPPALPEPRDEASAPSSRSPQPESIPPASARPSWVPRAPSAPDSAGADPRPADPSVEVHSGAPIVSILGPETSPLPLALDAPRGSVEATTAPFLAAVAIGGVIATVTIRSAGPALHRPD